MGWSEQGVFGDSVEGVDEGAMGGLEPLDGLVAAGKQDAVPSAGLRDFGVVQGIADEEDVFGGGGEEAGEVPGLLEF